MVGGFWVLGMVLGLVLWLVLIAALAVVVLRLFAPRPPGRQGTGDDSAMALLRERFARGEIDEAEYLVRKQVLEETAQRRDET